MKIFFNVVLVVLVLLASSSGITKIMLMPQDVKFFGEFGFSNPVLIAFGVVQLIGGLLLVFPKTRVIGAGVVILTFLVSAAVLVMAEKLGVAAVTLGFVALAGLLMQQSLPANNGSNDPDPESP